MSNYKFVPVPAGFYALWRTEAAPGYGRTIITAWQIDAEETYVSWTSALPEGDTSIPMEAILCPDGTVQEIDSGRFWKDVGAWLEFQPMLLAA
jgi:hypothetical protein